ncbi:protein adenylyltransferase SelO [Flavicella marina]|uniref:protein adenylyltransferase SelO n=1 Tax=Flavicella marina TaxID=1475951 RepID=UPI0012646701|nr:YdiU family protein [Flavicella marina]
MRFKLKNTFIQELPADSIEENSRRQVYKACYSFVSPKTTENPELIHTSKEVLDLLGISEKEAKSKDFLNIFTGNQLIENAKPYAMCYGGHQFGNWAGQLGDGRAINLAEIENKGDIWALQLKGAGPTPYSRTADGLAVLRSSIREYLCSEAMHHLGVPTTRALSLALTGDNVLRDVLYNGNPAYEKGAIVCRISPSFLRFGNYEIFAAREEIATLQQLVDYTISNFFPELGKPSKKTYLKFFEIVADRTLDMIIHWQRVGFVHGVMNTDNLSILGLTIDYGPYGWLEGYDYNWTPNTTDRQHKRYRYGNQANIGLWNLLKLANALYPLIEETASLEAILENYKVTFEKKYHLMMKSKLGLFIDSENDKTLISDLENNLHLSETDMTLFFRSLSEISKNDSPKEAIKKISHAFYKPQDITASIEEKWLRWFQAYSLRLKEEPLQDTDRLKKMNLFNPKYVLRNYMAQLAIDAADKGDYTVLEELFELLKHPYSEQKQSEKWFAKRPEWARNKVGCSMLSCSS